MPPPTIAHYNGTLQWHPATSPKLVVTLLPKPLHTTMAPCNGTTYSSKVGRHPPCPHHTALQWHPAMAPHPLPKFGRHPRPATIAQQWHPAMAPRPLPQSWSPPTIAHYNGTLRWHSKGTTSSAPCNGTLVPRPIRQSGSSPSPLLEVRTPIAIATWGIIILLLVTAGRLCGNLTFDMPRVFFQCRKTLARCSPGDLGSRLGQTHASTILTESSTQQTQPKDWNLRNAVDWIFISTAGLIGSHSFGGSCKKPVAQQIKIQRNCTKPWMTIKTWM